MNSYTKKQIANSLGVNYSVAHGVVEFLVARGIAKPNGKIETGTAGKPSTTYEIPDTFPVDFGALGIPNTPPVSAPPKVRKSKAKAKTDAAPVADATPVVDEPTAPIGTLTENPAAETVAEVDSTPAPVAAPAETEVVTA